MDRFDPATLRGPFALQLSSAPAAEPLSLIQAKAHLRVDFTDDDSLISALITASRQAIEERTGICFVRQSWAFSFQNWFEWEFNIPRAYPLSSVDSVVYWDVNDTQQTLDSSVYQVSKTARIGRIRPNWNQVWPALWYRMDAATVTHTSGYLFPVTADATGDTLGCTAHPFLNGDAVIVYAPDGAPAGLTSGSSYYVVGKTTNALQVSATSGGSAIDITSAGTGQVFIARELPPAGLLAAVKLLLGHLYENRQEVVAEPGRAVAIQVPVGVDALIAPYIDYSYRF